MKPYGIEYKLKPMQGYKVKNQCMWYWSQTYVQNHAHLFTSMKLGILILYIDTNILRSGHCPQERLLLFRTTQKTN